MIRVERFPKGTLAVSVLVTVLCVSGCINPPSMGRMYPLLPVERSQLTCESALVELTKADQFCQHISEVNDVSCAEYVASSVGLGVPVVNIGVAIAQADNMAVYEEAKAAMKSASVRRAYLTGAYTELDCGSPPPSHCPLVCDVSVPWQALESGFWCNSSCVRLSRGERKVHGAILDDSAD